MEPRLTKLFTRFSWSLAFFLPTHVYAKEFPSIRIDCLHFFADESDTRGTQPCANISGLRMQFYEETDYGVSTLISIDPFASASSSRSHLPFGVWRPSIQETPFQVVDEYGLSWQPRNNFEMKLGSHGGVAEIPSHSGLSMSQSLIENGWDQTALSLSYNLAALDGMKVRFVVGNGEGENGANLDPQQYMGFQSRLAVVPGVVASVGLSQDGNSAGSLATEWQIENAGIHCDSPIKSGNAYKGYSTQRKSLAIEVLEGVLLSGLSLAGGVHSVVQSDLDKNQTLHPDYNSLGCKRIEPSLVFVEDPNQNIANRIQRVTSTINASYRFFDQWFVGLDFAKRSLDTGDIHLFSNCEKIEQQLCRGESQKLRSIGESTFSVGGGVELDKELMLTLEYSRQSFDELYNYAWFLDSGHAVSSRDIFNVRISWRWTTM